MLIVRVADISYSTLLWLENLASSNRVPEVIASGNSNFILKNLNSEKAIWPEKSDF